MLDLSLKNEPIDMLSLSTKLSEQKLLEKSGEMIIWQKL